jgi:hypothetical protein
VKIIFLDIDGVMNTASWLNTQPPFSLRLYPERALHPVAVQRLNDITEQTGAAIVISSTWRMKMGLQRLREVFAGVGLRATIIDVTPSLPMRDDTLALHREQELISWLRRHPEVQAYIVLDDLPIGGAFSPTAILIDPEVGLTDDDASRAVDILRNLPDAL